MELIKSNSSITIPEISDKFNVSLKTINRDIEKLKQKSILKRIGPAKGGYWEILGDF